MIKPNEPMKYACWISPDGKIYSCPREGHVHLAWAICEMLGIEEEVGSRPDDKLLSLKWLKIASNGDIFRHKNPGISQKQIDAVWDIISTPWQADPPEVIKNFTGMGDRYIHGNEDGWNNKLKRALYFYGVTVDGCRKDDGI